MVASLLTSRAADETKIYETMRSGDLARLKALLASGVSPNERDEYGNTLLIQAAVYGRTDALKTLLDAGADVNAANKAGATALMRAAGDDRKIKLLVERGANVNARSGLGNTPLILAARAYGSVKSVELLLNKGAEVGVTNVFGANALTTAAAAGDAETVKLLLKRGADVNTHARANQEAVLWGGGRSALMWAAARGDSQLAGLLLDAGADVNSPEGFGTALTQSAWMDRPEVARLLLKRGANVHMTEQMSGFTALHWAASSERNDNTLVDLLLKRGADVNASGGEQVDAYLGIAQTPLMLARRRGETEIVRTLVAAGGKENAFPKKSDDAVLRELLGAPDNKTLRQALTKSAPNLEKSAIVSKDAFVKHASRQDCVSCHQQFMPMAALANAAASGAVTDSSAEEQLLAMVRRDSTNLLNLTFEATFHPEPAHGYGYMLFGMAEKKEKPSPVMDAMIHHLLVIQGKDGNWFNNLPRSPVQHSDVSATALAAHALAVYGFPAQRELIQDRIMRARKWLANFRPTNAEDQIWQLEGLAWCGESPAQLKKLAAVLVKEQRADGGWSQLPKLNTDPYATGHALHALHLAGVRAKSPEFQRGLEYLLKTQRDDGTWFSARRAFPFQPTMPSGFAHGKDSWVSCSASSWATIALSLGVETSTAKN